jgi:hypothetical protein
VVRARLMRSAVTSPSGSSSILTPQSCRSIPRWLTPPSTESCPT